MIVSQFRVQNRASEKAPPRIYGFYLTNLGDKFYSFRVTLYAESAAPLDQSFRLDYGEWGDDLSSYVEHVYSGGYFLGAGRHETILVRLVPIAGAPDADVSGHVELSIPMVGEVVDYKYLLTKTVTQGDKPVPVLVHAFETSAPNDQGRAITLASGQARNEILPDQELPDLSILLSLTLAGTEAGTSSASERRRDETAYIGSPSARAALLPMLGQVAESAEYVAAVNEQLEQAGHPLRLTSAKPRRPRVRK